MGITIEGLARRFGAFAALDGIDLEIRQGELLALLGPSGSGKTTLLRVIAGLEQADTGRVLFDGRDATALPVQERGVGFVFQHYALFKHMTVADNIGFGLHIRRGRRRLKRGEIDARVRELLALVQLEGLEKRFPAQLSGGQRQRVALARALAIEPQVLLLDEPFGALDAQVRRELRRWLRQVHERTGVTTVFVTHDQEEALELADRVAILNRGRLEQVGTPAEVYDHPATPFVHGFVGEVNRIPVLIRDGRLHAGGAQFPLSDVSLAGPHAWLLVRPQDLQPVGEGEAVGTQPVLAAMVETVQRSGARQRVLGRLGDGTAVEVDLPARQRVVSGEELRLQVLHHAVFAAD
ncbi:MAG: sulfate ABC transporter ATP-binding protein [Pseudoxanthomonas sp.]